LFIYLTDVDQEGGPHVVIEGTHHKEILPANAHPVSEQRYAYRQYAERIRVIYGASGEGSLKI